MKRVSFLPVIMTDYNDEERKALWQTAQKYIKNGKWTGAKSGNRPKIGMVTESSRLSAAAGVRKYQKNNSGAICKTPQVQVCVSQLVLVSHGFFPSEDDEASHICHEPTCVDVDHLVWERGDFNRRRKKCFKLRRCVCEQARKCLFDQH